MTNGRVNVAHARKKVNFDIATSCYVCLYGYDPPCYMRLIELYDY